MLGPLSNHKQLRFIILGLVCFSLLGIIVFQLTFSETTGEILDQETIAALERIETLGKATGSYQAELIIEIKKGGETKEIKGEAKFKWPNMQWEKNRYPTKNGYRIALNMSNGKIRWNYIPRLKLAFKYDIKAINEDARQKGWISAGYMDEKSIRYVGREKLDHEDMYVFKGTQSALRKSKTSKHLEELRMYLSAKDGTIRKIVSQDHEGQESYTQTFFNIRKDSSISEKDFEFTPPQGTQVQEIKDVGSRTPPSD